MIFKHLSQYTSISYLKKVLTLSCLLIASIYSQAQDIYTSQSSYKYGVIDLKGKVVVPFIYDKIEAFKNGHAKVTKKEKVGLINTSATEVVPCLYDEIKNVEDNMAVVLKNGVYGVISTSNDTIIPLKNQSITNYYEGTFLVYYNYQFGIIDSTGATTVPFSASIGTPFSGGDGYVLTTRTENNDQKIIDRHNNEIYVFPGYGVRDFNDGYLGIWKKKVSDKLAMYLNKNKNQADEIVTYKIVNIDGEAINDSLTIEYNLVFDKGLSRISRDNKVGVINIKGQQVIPCEYSRIYDFKDGLAKVRQDTSFLYGKNKYGMITNKGKLIIPCTFDGLENIKEGRILALLNQKYGYMDATGKQVITFDYDYAQDFENGYAIVASKNKYGLIDKQGKVIVPLLYDQIKPINEQYYIVSQNLQFGIINIEGKIKTPIKYKSLNKLSDSNYIAAQQDQMWGIIDPNGNEIAPFIYSEIASYSEGLFIAKPHPSSLK